MDLNLLRTFVAVADCLSFSAAADRLGYTQSAVSQQIAALESDLGVAVLDRRPVRLTEAGGRLLEHARPILLRMQAARADVRRIAGEPPGRIRLAATPLAVDSDVAAALGQARRSRPGLMVLVRVATRADVTAVVAVGEFDLGLVDGIAAPSDPLRLPDATALTALAISEEPLVVAMPEDHPLGRRAGVSLGDLVDAQWIDAPDVTAPLAEIRSLTGAAGLPGSIHYEGTDSGGLVALVGGGHGLALAPARTVEGVAGVRGVPVTSPRLVHRVELLHHRLTDPASSALAAALTARSSHGGRSPATRQQLSVMKPAPSATFAGDRPARVAKTTP